jgi:hypothetical protein
VCRYFEVLQSRKTSIFCQIYLASTHPKWRMSRGRKEGLNERREREVLNKCAHRNIVNQSIRSPSGSVNIIAESQALNGTR